MENNHILLGKFCDYLATSGCMLCSARRTGREVIPRPFRVPGSMHYTKPERPVMLVLSHPRETDEKDGRILKGAERITLLRWLSEIPYPALYITTAVKCRSDEDREPRKKEINTCASTYLVNEIALLQPKIIFAMGKVATKALLNCTDKIASDKMLTRVPHVMKDTSNKFIWSGAIYPIYHPAYFQMGAGEHEIDEQVCITQLQKGFEENGK